MSRLSLVASVGGAALSGILTRPCCAMPLALSTFGLSSAVVAQFVATHRPALLVASACLLAASCFITLRRSGGTTVKVISVSMSIAAFFVSRAWMGGL